MLVKKTAAWTGDIHAAERIHLNPAFAWITEQIELNVFAYLGTLGHDVPKFDVYIQRAWPVVSSKGEGVPVHSHHTAQISAIYYIDVPGGADSGCLRFQNTSLSNELSKGIGGYATSGYSTYNDLNFSDAAYEPIEGRLILFPAKQSHSVDTNKTNSQRISISYDLLLTSREDGDPGLHEYLSPPPAHWRKCNRHNN